MITERLFKENMNSIFFNLLHKLYKDEIEIEFNLHHCFDSNIIIESYIAYFTFFHENTNYKDESSFLKIELIKNEEITVHTQLSSGLVSAKEFFFENNIQLTEINNFYSNSILEFFSEFIDTNYHALLTYLKKNRKQSHPEYNKTLSESLLKLDLIKLVLDYKEIITEKIVFITEYKYKENFEYNNSEIYRYEVIIHDEPLFLIIIIKVNFSLHYWYQFVIRMDRIIDEKNEVILSVFILGMKGFVQQHNINLSTNKNLSFEIRKIIENFSFSNYYEEFLTSKSSKK